MSSVVIVGLGGRIGRHNIGADLVDHPAGGLQLIGQGNGDLGIPADVDEVDVVNTVGVRIHGERQAPIGVSVHVLPQVVQGLDLVGRVGDVNDGDLAVPGLEAASAVAQVPGVGGRVAGVDQADMLIVAIASVIYALTEPVDRNAVDIVSGQDIEATIQSAVRESAAAELVLIEADGNRLALKVSAIVSDVVGSGIAGNAAPIILIDIVGDEDVAAGGGQVSLEDKDGVGPSKRRWWLS